MMTAYSPYNRTYKYICLQNQLSHIKNKATVRSKGQSNISLIASPEKHNASNTKKLSLYQSTNVDIDSVKSLHRKNSKNKEDSYIINDEHRIIHKNYQYELKRKRQQNR